MALLKEDGSLDIERINSLPYEEPLKTDGVQRINHRDATAPMVINMNAQDEIKRGNAIEVLPDGTILSFYDQRRKASAEIYDRLTQGIFDNVGENIVLRFGRTEMDMTTSNVDFYFRKLRLLSPKRFVLEGCANMSRSPTSRKMQIDYRFDRQQFYEAVYCANGTVRDMKPLKLDYAGSLGEQNIETVKNIIQFLTMCLYSIEDGKTDINSKPYMNEKPLIPFK